MDTIQIYLELPSEFQQLLSDNGITVERILRDENIDARVSFGILPTAQDATVRSKEPVLIILASAAAVLAVGSAISQVIHALYRKPYLVEVCELIEQTDAAGNVILDTGGKPSLIQVKKYDLLEPRKEDSSHSLETGMNSTKGLVIKFNSSAKQIEPQKK